MGRDPRMLPGGPGARSCAIVRNGMFAMRSYLSGRALLIAAVFVLAIAVQFGAAPAALADSYYVSPSGSDSNSGTSPRAPWKTIARVNSAGLGPGDTVYFERAGLWRETLAPSAGGVPGAPVTFTAYGTGAPPVISGSDLVAGWTPFSGGVYRAPLGQQPRNVYVDGGPGWGLVHASGSGAIQPGSWSWDRKENRLYIELEDRSKPDAHRIEAAVRDGIRMVANGGEKSYLVIDGLRIERTSGYGIFVYSSDRDGRGPEGIVIRNNLVTQTGTGRIDDHSYFNAIHYSQAREMETAPVFERNTIAYSGNHGNAINCQNADGARIVGNDASHFNHHGFDMKHCASVLVSGNLAHDSEESNGIYQEYCANGRIENNFVYNVHGSVPGRGSGIQIDVGSSGARISHNSVYNVRSGIYLTVPASADRNVIMGASYAALVARAGGAFDANDWGPEPALYLGGTRLDFGRWKMLGHLSDVALDPGWRDPGRGDFTLPPGSALTGMGAALRSAVSQ